MACCVRGSLVCSAVKPLPLEHIDPSLRGPGLLTAVAGLKCLRCPALSAAAFHASRKTYWMQPGSLQSGHG